MKPQFWIFQLYKLKKKLYKKENDEQILQIKK